jgi:hypothetical protein
MSIVGGTWGAIADCTREGLWTSDIAIIAARNRLLKMVREFQDGIDPYAAYHGDLYNIRPLDVVSEEDDLLRLVSNTKITSGRVSDRNLQNSFRSVENSASSRSRKMLHRESLTSRWPCRRNALCTGYKLSRFSYRELTTRPP